MARQERAIRTHRAVLEAAATVFAEDGYAAAKVSEILKAAGVTKGALYFHFDSKEALARGVLDVQTALALPPRDLKLQELVDVVMVVAHRLPYDPMLRAGARLSQDPKGRKQYGSAWPAWIEVLEGRIVEAQARGEALAHVEPRETAELVLTSFNGAQIFSQLEHALGDFEHRIAVFFQHIMPSVAVPAVLGRLDMSEDRGARVYAQMEIDAAAEEAVG
ncbi:ScbR family autoregulator-binding transcription factor [Kitasatospora sp. LaBMicrA B282]|uniref:ScbR family autoregulator-binding transcription factor n=1 Tax=Kitasatospora sp. LaBMicrA B282 TaxID=3420949 RepID=UPI003D1295E4